VSAATAAQLIRDGRFEVIPLKSLDAQTAHLPAGCSVSVTCSPNKGPDVSVDIAAALQAAGHHAVPHIAARLVESPQHVEKLAAAMAEHGLTEVFVVAGDPDPVGPYGDGLALLHDLLPVASSITTIGIPAYPDHHPLISDHALHTALHDKQRLIHESGRCGFASTQMCFNPTTIVSWLRAERESGFTLPVHLGVPGAVERTRLITLSTKIGVGVSLRYLRKNSGAIMRMFQPSGYTPSKLIRQLAPHADELGIEGLHLFTFNSVESTAAWQRSELL
jgi:methylenetetrahydrofolate reductase (NADPH)